MPSGVWRIQIVGGVSRRKESPVSATSEAAAAGQALQSANPLGTDGFEFVEYTAPDTRHLARLFESMGFSRIARHRSKDVALYRQGDINYIVNAEPNSLAQQFAREHGPSACAMAFRVENAQRALREAVAAGGRGVAGAGGATRRNTPPS